MTQKVANPCGVVTSKLSVTLIGQYEQGAAERVARQAQQIRDQRVDFYKALDASKRVGALSRPRGATLGACVDALTHRPIRARPRGIAGRLIAELC